MNILYFLILVAGLIVFCLAAFSRRAYRVDLVALGLALVTLVPVLQRLLRLND